MVVAEHLLDLDVHRDQRRTQADLGGDVGESAQLEILLNIVGGEEDSTVGEEQRLGGESFVVIELVHAGVPLLSCVIWLAGGLDKPYHHRNRMYNFIS